VTGAPAGWLTFGKFQLVGAVTTAVSVPLMWGLDRLGVPYPVYTALNYLVSLGLGFVLNFRFTFAGRPEDRLPAALRYAGGFGALLAVVLGLQTLLIDGAGWGRFWGVGFGMAFYAAGAWLVSRHWIFPPPRR